MPPRSPTPRQRRQATPARPGADKVQGLLNSGLAYGSKGQLKDALRCLDKALQINPNDSRALFAKGQILAEQLNFSRLLFALGRYDDLRCDDPVLYYVVGYYYFRLKRYEKALQNLTQAVQLKTSYTIARLLMAEIYAELDKQADCRRTLSGLPPTTALTPKESSSCADVLIKLRQYDEALPLLEDLLSHDDMSVKALDKLSRFPGAQMPDWVGPTLESQLGRQNLSSKDRMYLHFAAGRVLDLRQEFDRAFYHFEHGNRLAGQDFDADAVRACVSSLVTLFDGKFEDPPSPAATEEIVPVFIVGLPSAGKTTLETQLIRHPNIAGAKERDMRMYIDEEVFVGIDGVAPRALQSRSLKVSTAKQQQYSRDYIDAVVSSLMMQTTPKVLLNTLPLNVWNCGVIKRMFPHARFIHVTRNSIDLCLSNYFRAFNDGYSFSNSLQSVSAYWKLYARMAQHWRYCLADSWLDVSYEALVSDPSGTVAGVCQFLGLPGDNRAATCAAGSARLTDRYIGRWVNYEAHLRSLVEALEVDTKGS